MTPNKLLLKNFHGIRAGTGCDEIEIDIDKLAQGAALVLLKGDNGAGKTTLLDNLHPYRVMPSRASSYSPASFSFYDQTYGDAQKVLDWHHDGVAYRSILNIKQTEKTKKTECFLQVQKSPDQFVPYKTTDNIVSDGKTATYDAAVEEILGTAEMFFTSAFSSQGKKHLSSYTNSDIKLLMAELLNLGGIMDLSVKAAEVTKQLTARMNGLRQEQSLYGGKIEVIHGMKNDLEATKLLIGPYVEKLAAAEKHTDKAENDLLIMKKLHEDSTAAKLKREDLQKQYDMIGHAAVNRIAEINNDRKVEGQRKESIFKRKDGDISDIKHRRIEATKKIEHLDSIISRSAEITAAVDRLDPLAAELEQAEQDGKNARARESKLIEILAETENKKTQLEGWNQVLQGYKSTLDELIKRAKLIDDVPCNGTAMQSSCMLLLDSNLANKAVPEKEKEYKTQAEKILILQITLDDLSSEAVTYKSARQEVEDAVKRYKSLNKETLEVKQLAALTDTLEAAITEKKSAETLVNNLDQRLAETEAEYIRTLSDVDARIADLSARITAVETKALQQQEILKNEIDKFQVVDSATIDECKEKHDQAKLAQPEVSKKIVEIQNKESALKERIEVMEKEVAGLSELKARHDAIEAEISHWQILTKALGRDGIIALTIDDSGPTLSTLTNELLKSCYGPRFTVSIETQAQTTAGTNKETFDIRVFDGDRNESKSVKAMSGGERIYINEAMTRAIALYQAQLSGRQYGTLFSDESDGALDPERKVMFTNMKRKVLELGGYKQEIFITHTPELWDLADAVIDVSSLKAN